MSHFTVLVVTDKPEDLEETLQPFHEYECTGIEDQYVVFTPAEESLEDMQALHKEHLKDYPDSTPDDFAEHVEDYYGYELRDGAYGRMTNPNKQWDWWLIGGRWPGSLTMKEGKAGNSGRKPLIMGGGESEGVDQAIKGDVDFETRMNEAAEKAAKEYDETHAIIDSRDYQSWKECRENFKLIGDAREYYNKQSVVVDLKKKYDNPFADLDKYKTDRESFVKTEASSAISTFAMIKDGQWYERGDMGWWGCVGDEKERDDWNGEFKDLLDAVPDDKWLTVVDCHI